MCNGSLLKSGSLLAASLFLVTSNTAVCSAQQTADQTGFVEASWMKVKQDKVGEFGQMATRIADANRRGKGDHWIAAMDFYGRDNTVWILARRDSLAEVEPGMNKLFGAVKEMMGYSPERFFAETSKVVESSGTELWRMRFDLSWNVKNMDDWASQVAKARYLLLATIRTKPGHTLEAEKQLGMLKDALAAHEGTRAGFVAQLALGGDPGTYYVRVPFETIADFEKVVGPRAALGEEGYQKYSEMAVANYVSIEYSMKRLVPEWSSPSAAILEANPTMWKVKPMMSAKPKPATADKAATTGAQ